MFLCVKKRAIVLVLCFIVLIGGVVAFFSTTRLSAMPALTHKIVIDAGHGGRDGGAVGKTTGVSESELNLKYALTLRNLCEQFGIDVVLTRQNMDGLYEEDAPNKKRSEMEKRKSIINGSGADLMISLHMNSFPLASSEGAHVFYAKGSESGFALAKAIQQSVCQNFTTARKYVSVGDYFVLNYSAVPAVLIECGFLSNPKEEVALTSEEYRESFCYHVLAGIISYFKM